MATNGEQGIRDAVPEQAGKGPEPSNETATTLPNALSPSQLHDQPDAPTGNNEIVSNPTNGNQDDTQVSTENSATNTAPETSHATNNHVDSQPVTINTGKENKQAEPETTTTKSIVLPERGYGGKFLKSTKHYSQTSITHSDHNDYLIGSPVREITVHKHSNTNSLPRVDSSKRLRKAPNDLDEKTMRIVLQYLKENTTPKNYLNDDEIGLFMVRMNRASDRQTEHHHSLLGDSDDSDTSLFNEILAEEEECAIGQAYCKEILANIRKVVTDYELDSRTVGWIRRAAGLHRNKPEQLLRESTSDVGKTADGAVKTRRSTRQQKIQRRDKGIHLLADALDDVEDEIGRFEKVKINIKRKREQPVASAHEEDSVKKHKATSTESAANKTLIAKLTTREYFPNGLSFEKFKHVRISRIIVNGSLLGEATMISDNNRRSNGKERLKQPVKRASARDMCLKRHLLRQSRHNSISAASFNGSESKESYFKVVRARIPRALKANGVQFRLPRWETLNKTYSSALHPPRQRHSDDVYASFCTRLVQSLNGSAAAWASREFFYSDIDREWFGRNEIIEEVVKLGLSTNARLTMAEWRFIRRRVKAHPRRFSRRFIQSQLEELRKYRARVRLLQHSSPDMFRTSVNGNIPAPIPFGTMVTAYSNKYEIILRGMVLAHEAKSFAYLVQFNRKQFGNEFCPDYAVATHGGPSILIPRKRPFGVSELSVSGSAKGALMDSFSAPRADYKTKLNDALIFDPYPCPTSDKRVEPAQADAKHEAVGQAAEKEALVGLLAIVDIATRRKAMLLGALEEASSVVKVNGSRASRQFLYTCEWLKRNLVQTEHVLETALPKLRLMYGKLYLPEASTVTDYTGFDTNRSTLIQKTLTAVTNSSLATLPQREEWIMNLATGSAQVSTAMASIVMRRALLDRRAAQPSAEELWFTERRLQSVGDTLLTASYGRRFARMSKLAESVPPAWALTACMKGLFISPDIPDVVEADDLFIAVKAGRDAAAEDLKDAFSLLQTELLVATTQKALKETPVTL